MKNVLFKFGTTFGRFYDAAFKLNILKEVKNKYNIYNALYSEQTRKKTENTFQSLVKQSFHSLSFKEIEDYCDKIQNEYNFELLIATFFDFSYNFDKYLTHILNDKEYKINYQSTNNTIKNMYFIWYLNTQHNIPLKYFVVDPLEPDTNKWNNKNESYHFYDGNRFKYFPFVEYEEYYIKKENLIEKSIDFTFGCANNNYSEKHRGKIIEDLLNSKLNNLYFLDNIRKIKTFLKPIEYNKMIEKSRYTLIIPSIKYDEFSLMRFHDAISRKCIPFLHSTVKYDHSCNHMMDIKEFINENLVVEDIKDLENKIKNGSYNKLLNEINELESIKKFRNFEYYKKYVESF